MKDGGNGAWILTLSLGSTLGSGLNKFAELTERSPEDIAEDFIRDGIVRMATQHKLFAGGEKAKLEAEGRVLAALDTIVSRIALAAAWGEDVINEILLEIRDEHLEDYRTAIGTDDPGRLNRRIGAKIKRGLGAEHKPDPSDPKKRLMGHNSISAKALNKTWTKLIPGKGAKS